MLWTIPPAAIACRLAGPAMLALAASCGGGGGEIELTPAGSSGPLTLIGVTPSDGATAVPVDQSVSFTYSEALAEPPGIVLFGPNGKAVSGTTRVDGATAVFTPHFALAHHVAYAASAHGGVALGGAVPEQGAPPGRTGFRTAASPLAPAIEWADEAVLTFNARAGAAVPPAQSMRVLNAGGGTLGGLYVASIEYGKGADGWVRSARLDATTAPTALRVEVDTAGVAAGEYIASIWVAAPTATNLSRKLAVRLRVD